jgi:hypothetical protein
VDNGPEFVGLALDVGAATRHVTLRLHRARQTRSEWLSAERQRHVP